MIKIDKNIAIPELDVGANNKYPYKQMEIGDSFAMSYPNEVEAHRIQINALAGTRALRLKGRKFTSRKDSKTKTIRIWRIK